MQQKATDPGIVPAKGGIAGGNTVIITGAEAFTTAVNQVLFGNVAANYQVLNNGTIQATVPQAQSGAGSVSIVVFITGVKTDTNLSYTYAAPQIDSLSVDTGGLAGGTYVTITGQYLTGVSSVLFNNTAGNITTVATATEVTVTSPANGSTEAVSVSASAYGVASSQNGTFTYCAPIVSGVSPASGKQVGGTQVTISGQYLTGTTLVKFGNEAQTTLNVANDTSITLNSPAGGTAGVVDVTVQVQGVISATSTEDQFAYIAPALTITFTNDTNSNYANSSVLIGFFDGTAPAVPAPGSATVAVYAVPNITFNITNKADGSIIYPLQLSPDFTADNAKEYGYPFAGNWYNLDQLSNGVNINNFSGRIYVVYGVGSTPIGWQFPAVANGGWGYTPNSAGQDSPDFYIRYDQMELTFNGSPNDVADLTTINFWSIPMSLSTLLADTPVATVTGLWNNATANSTLAALASVSPTSKVPGSFTPTTGVTYLVPPGNFARMIGPASYPPTTITPASSYDNFSGYLTWLQTQYGPATKAGNTVPKLGDGVIATISGNFAGVTVKNPLNTQIIAPQTYSLTAKIDDSGDIILSGTASVVGKIAMKFTNADLIASPGIYGGNVACAITPLPYSAYPGVPGNDIYGWIAADLYLGLNIGAVGSTTKNTSGTMIGALKSCEWYSLTKLYDQLQSTPSYYNQWSAALHTISQAYNFAYSDRLSAFHYLISLNPQNVDTMNISLMDFPQGS